jgi:hypothetical protein
MFFTIFKLKGLSDTGWRGLLEKSNPTLYKDYA